MLTLSFVEFDPSRRFSIKAGRIAQSTIRMVVRGDTMLQSSQPSFYDGMVPL
jgi:hypothetical protein